METNNSVSVENHVYLGLYEWLQLNNSHAEYVTDTSYISQLVSESNTNYEDLPELGHAKIPEFVLHINYEDMSESEFNTNHTLPVTITENIPELEFNTNHTLLATIAENHVYLGLYEWLQLKNSHAEYVTDMNHTLSAIAENILNSEYITNDEQLLVDSCEDLPELVAIDTNS